MQVVREQSTGPLDELDEVRKPPLEELDAADVLEALVLELLDELESLLPDEPLDELSDEELAAGQLVEQIWIFVGTQAEPQETPAPVADARFHVTQHPSQQAANCPR